jgi:hypothetical protein
VFVLSLSKHEKFSHNTSQRRRISSSICSSSNSRKP